MGQEMHEFLPGDEQDGVQPGPSWARNTWPLVGGAAEDDLTQALDPLALREAIRKAAQSPAAPALDEAALERAAADSIRAMLLIRTYRVRGHLAADLDPLGLARQDIPADLSPEYHGFVAADLDRKIYIGGTLGLQWATVRDIVAILRANYCGKVGFEYMHIADVEERRFIQDRIEGGDKAIDFTANGKKAILAAVVRGEQYEKFLGKKYVGT
ncbi:MAG TPA: 2-oxoglutarate dehydrogenase E1 component, partial [Novosphingobium sp.]